MTCYYGTEKDGAVALIFFNLGTKWGGWTRIRPGQFTPGRGPGTHYVGRSVRGSRSQSRMLRNISPTTGFLTPNHQARSYTDYAILPATDT